MQRASRNSKKNDSESGEPSSQYPSSQTASFYLTSTVSFLSVVFIVAMALVLIGRIEPYSKTAYNVVSSHMDIDKKKIQNIFVIGDSLSYYGNGVFSADTYVNKLVSSFSAEELTPTPFVFSTRYNMSYDDTNQVDDIISMIDDSWGSIEGDTLFVIAVGGYDKLDYINPFLLRQFGQVNYAMRLARISAERIIQRILDGGDLGQRFSGMKSIYVIMPFDATDGIGFIPLSAYNCAPDDYSSLNSGHGSFGGRFLTPDVLSWKAEFYDTVNRYNSTLINLVDIMAGRTRSPIRDPFFYESSHYGEKKSEINIYTEDCVHLNQHGHEALFRQIYQALKLNK